MIAYSLVVRSDCSHVWSGDLTPGDLVPTEGTKQSFASYLIDLILTEAAQWTLMSSRVSLLDTFSRLV